MARHTFLREHIPKGWYIGAAGAYYAFVRHPFAGKTAKEVCRRLAGETGVLALPIQFFSDDAAMRGMMKGWERWIRVSVANVDEKHLADMCRRLAEVADVWGWEVDA
jgi:aspartate/methionine/tyrosine aminotransferase